MVAQLGKLDYPEVIIVPRLGPGKVALFRLPNIPLQDLFVEGDDIVHTYDHFRVFVTQIVKSGKTEMVTHEGHMGSPTYTDFLNGNWSRRWGYLYNLDAVKFYKSEMRDRFNYYVYNEFWAFHRDLSPAFRTVVLNHHYLLLPNRYLCRFLCQDWMLTAICWTVLLLRLQNIEEFARRRGYLQVD